MKVIENKRFMEFLQKGNGEFGWTTDFLLKQIVSVCSVLSGGAENPKITEEARKMFLEMFRDSSISASNLWDNVSIAQIVNRYRRLSKSSEETFRFLFDMCRAVDGKAWGSTASAPLFSK